MRQVSGYQLAFGITPEEMETMTIVNPCKILGVDPNDALQRSKLALAA